jgi:hypothetical protein
MAIEMLGVQIGAQSNLDRPDWNVTYSQDNRHRLIHTVSGDRARSSWEAMEIAKQDLGVTD